jgi:flagellar biosynthesis/type III secretory pathway protein FliH
MTPGRGRIVRDGQEMTAVTLASGPTEPAWATVSRRARGRIVRRERLEVAWHAAGMVALAQEQAEALVREAQEEADRICQGAEQRGLEQGAARLAAAWLRLEQREAALDETSLERSVAIARLLAERLLGTALRLDAEVVADMAREAMIHLWRSRRVIIHAHPEDVPSLERHVATYGMPPERVQIQADPDRKRGCLRFVSDFGELDGDIGPQLDRLVDVIRQELGARGPA